MNSRDLHNEITAKLIDAHYRDSEADSISLMVIEYFYGLSRVELLLNKVIDNAELHVPALNELLEGKPIQYILGEAHFYGLVFKVDPSVLIPRQETEELVDLIIKENKSSKPVILDIGTGSGCIAISLAKHITESKTYGYDISRDALMMAIQNAANNGVQINFQEVDILESDIHVSEIDIIVSNPPYVRCSEKPQMDKRVLNYEPALALYVKDTNPLVFYNRISQVAAKALSNTGKLYFEINEAFPEEVVKCMENEGFENVLIINDLNGKPRFVKGSLP